MWGFFDFIFIDCEEWELGWSIAKKNEIDT